ncbi:MAG: hypothetical protein M3O26_18570 [Pseudomonadota bacterium]|nr:hypothetical protein [Pseudomonadota bacterium]
MDKPTKSVIKGISLSCVAPALVYLMIFHHAWVETDGEVWTASLLSLAGFMAAMKSSW